MFALESHRTRREARRARNQYVRAQRIVDHVYEQITGEQVFPAAEDIYLVEPRDESFVVMVNDPSLEADLM